MTLFSHARHLLDKHSEDFGYFWLRLSSDPPGTKSYFHNINFQQFPHFAATRRTPTENNESNQCRRPQKPSAGEQTIRWDFHRTQIKAGQFAGTAPESTVHYIDVCGRIHKTEPQEDSFHYQHRI